MKTLLLIRHAKSSWDQAGLSDRDRPLNPRGERDVQTMGRRLARRAVRPDLIVSSPALRALATAQALAGVLGHACDAIVVDERLYAATADRLRSLVDEFDDSLACVMLVGHNPEFSELAHRWAGSITHMPTCAAAEFGFDGERWKGLGRARPVRVTFDSPKAGSAGD